jgi:hypothetical protein
VFILKVDEVVCFDTLLEVLILKGVKEDLNGRPFEAPVEQG